MTVAPADPADLLAAAQRLISEYRRAEAERVLRRGLRRLASGPQPEPGSTTAALRDRMLLALAPVRAELGSLDEGLGVLAEVAGRLPSGDPLAGVVQLQHGLLLWRAGRVAEALPRFDAAAGLLALGSPERFALHLNRGSARLGAGQVAAARADYERAALAARAEGNRVRLVKALVSLAYVDYVRGDIPAALAGLDALLAGELPEEGLLAELRLMRADALLAAGLLAEADDELRAAVPGFARLRMVQDRAEAEALRAQLALAGDRPAAAVELAAMARRRFARRGSTAWALVAELIGLQARLEAGRPSRLSARAAVLAEALAGHGLADDAAAAALLTARALLRRGHPDAAAGWVARAGQLSGRRGIRVGTRLQARLVRAELAAATGRSARADTELRAGIRELHRYQASFGGLDAQTAVVRHGRELIRAGLTAALESGRPAEVFGWAEEGRALASRLPPVRPPADPDGARLLEELRLVRLREREAQLAGRPTGRLPAQRSELERQVRQRSWYRAGPGGPERPVRLARVRAALAGRPGQVLVAHLAVSGAGYAVVVTPDRARLVRLGDLTGAAETLRRVRADLDVLAVRGYPPGLRRTVLSSLGAGLATLDRALWAPLASLAGAGPVVLVPAGPLVTVPWTSLPGLRGRPVTVARSATAWVRAVTSPARPPAGVDVPGRVVAAAGPDLDRAEQEATDVAALWPGAQLLLGPAATGASLLAAAGGADVLHVAAHGRYEPANPLFSALRLADGPLFGYDVDRLPVPPRRVVLSACDLGMAASRPGDEVLGMTAALLHAGTELVVASVAQVNDEVARDVLVSFHRRLRAGREPAAALAEAIGDRPDAPFVCFGSGSGALVSDVTV